MSALARPRIAVLGIGTLGVTVAQLALDRGCDTILMVRPGAGKIARAEAALDRSLRREVRAGRMDHAGARHARGAALVTDDLRAVGDCDIVVECLPEVLATKRAGLAAIEPHLSDHAVFASSTSSLPASRIGAGVRRADRVVVLHYVWPANRMPLVEVAFPDQVADDVPDRVLDLLQLQAKQPLVVRDVPGFLITRAVLAYWSETIDVLAEGGAPELVDAEFEAAGWPIGPCRLLDAASLRTAVAVADAVGAGMTTPPIGLDRLRPLVEAGIEGDVSGSGLYRRDALRRRPNDGALAQLRRGTSPAPMAVEDARMRITSALVRETAACVDAGVVSSWEDAALGIDLAYGFAGGLLYYATAHGFVAASASRRTAR